MTKSSAWTSCLRLIVVFLAMTARSQTTPLRSISGVVVTDKNEPVAGATVVAEYSSGRQEMLTDSNGAFRLVVPSEAVTMNVVGRYLVFEGKHLRPRVSLRLRDRRLAPAPIEDVCRPAIPTDGRKLAGIPMPPADPTDNRAV